MCKIQGDLTFLHTPKDRAALIANERIGNLFILVDVLREVGLARVEKRNKRVAR